MSSEARHLAGARGEDFSVAALRGSALPRNDTGVPQQTKETPLNSQSYYVYILTNWNLKVMYIGITNDLERRIFEHKNHQVDGFIKKYHVDRLVYYEPTTDIFTAIAREKQLKKWRRSKKDALVQSLNPDWRDLTEEWE